ncbi:Nucleoside-diphosphate-sugar epimerase [Halopseudomonas xinjiangensis]|uniref:Nucleoside-diphosphate-sugar epimerase n=1 Tax=Halopseudomonas xinjiangensis TaxID=487184 RepID=A0A1H1NMJ0_9GAMM|nr:SDR family oxidoreductase [Halopseudomonas xinjiangensis]SDS00070.1 Nucleoside-diphosphate-sugar epimerase [Halopseudomonas xinjiangensis]
MTVYLTGASGFIGSRLLATLHAQGRDVVTIARERRDRPLSSKQVNLDDLASAGFVAGGRRVLVHCAGRAHVMNETAVDPLAAFRRANVELTVRLARMAAAAGVDRFVYLSSIKVNGEATLPGHPFTAFDEPHPLDAYGQSKWEAEEALKELAADTGMEIVIIRPVLVYGPGIRGNIRSMVAWIQRGLPLPLAAVDNTRSLLGLDNLVDLVITCLDHPAAANNTFLAADSEDISTPELVRRIAKAVGRDARLFPVPVAWMESGASMVGKKDRVQKLCGSLRADITHTCQTLGWRPPVSLDDGLRLMTGRSL